MAGCVIAFITEKSVKWKPKIQTQTDITLNRIFTIGQLIHKSVYAFNVVSGPN